MAVRTSLSRIKSKAYFETAPDSVEEPEFADRLWIFHRGMGLATFTGLLIMHKVDYYVERVLGKCCQRRKPKHVDPNIRSEDVTLPGAPEECRIGVQRRSIESEMKKHGFRACWRPLSLQEPTFKEVVLVYRTKAGADDFHSTENPHPLYVRVFRDIPEADLETLYPCKRTEMRPLDTLKFVGVAIYGVISVMLGRQAGELVGYSTLASFCGLLVTVALNYQYQQSIYQQATLRSLYSKAKDADSGAISYLMEEVELQEVRCLSRVVELSCVPERRLVRLRRRCWLSGSWRIRRSPGRRSSSMPPLRIFWWKCRPWQDSTSARSILRSSWLLGGWCCEAINLFFCVGGRRFEQVVEDEPGDGEGWLLYRHSGRGRHRGAQS